MKKDKWRMLIYYGRIYNLLQAKMDRHACLSHTPVYHDSTSHQNRWVFIEQPKEAVASIPYT